MPRRFLLTLTLFGLAAACGARTGDELSETDDGGIHHGGASTDGGDGGGKGGAAGTSSGGTVGSGVGGTTAGASGISGSGGFGVGGAAGSFGNGGSFGAAGSGGTGGVFCGGRVCTPVNSPVGTLGACCPSNAPYLCGIDTDLVSQYVPLRGCIAENQPGAFDPNCPTLSGPVGYRFPGCCKPNGMCGNDFNVIQLGCVDTSVYGGLPPRTCRGTGGFGGIAGAGGFGGAGAISGAGGVTTGGVGGSFGGTGGVATGGVGGSFGFGGTTSSGGAGGVGGSGFGGTSGSGGIDGGGGVGGVGQCVNQATGQCEVCLCTSCFNQLGQCIADFGCPEILRCVAQTGCRLLGCYQPSTCQAVIDSFGGLGGQSAQLALQLYQCSNASGCPCGFN